MRSQRPSTSVSLCRWPGAKVPSEVSHTPGRPFRSASRTGDPEIECRALAAYGDWHFRAGRGMQQAEMDRAMTLERSLPSWPLDRGPTGPVLPAARAGRGSRSWRGTSCTNSTTRTRHETTPTAPRPPRWWLSLLEWRAGNWEAAERYAADSFDVRTQLGQVMPGDGFPVALIAAHRGRVDEARAAAERDLADAEAMDIRISVSGSAWILGFLELSLGDPGAALSQLARSYELRSAFMLEPGQRPELGDYLEALVGVGEADRADEVITTWAGAGRKARPRLDARHPRAITWAAPLGVEAISEGASVSFEAVLRRACQNGETASSMPSGRRLRLARRSGEQNAAPTHARRHRQRWPSSSVSARPSGRTRPAPSSAGSVAARPRAAS